MRPLFDRPRAVLPAAGALAVLLLALPFAATAAEIVVRVSGMTDPLGQIGCSLFASGAGFPIDTSGARTVWLAADANGVTCRFSDVPEGSYAVSVGHDLNGNRKVDTNFVGLPTEQWGVSNNVRPTLRAPRFDEASFKVPGDVNDTVIDSKVAK